MKYVGFGEICKMIINSEPWFMGKDIAIINPRFSEVITIKLREGA